MAKQIYEVEYNGQIFEVEADSPEQVAAAFGGSEQPAEQPQQPEKEKTWRDLSGNDWLEGIWDAGMLAATSTIAQPVSGVAGLAGLAVGAAGTGPANDVAADWQKKTADLLTDLPDGEAAQVFGRMVGPTVEHLTQKVDDALYAEAGGSPEIASAMKTAVYGIPAVLGFHGMKVPKRFATWRANNKMGDELAAKATAEGVDLFDDNLPYSVRGYSERLVGGTQKGQGFDEVIDAVRTAEGVSKQAVDDAFDAARARTAVAELKPIQEAVDKARAQVFKEGADPKWRVYNARLKEIEQLTDFYTGIKTKTGGFGQTGRSHIDLDELEIMRRRLNGSIKTAKPGSPEGRALIQIRNSLDDGIDDLLQKGAISGDEDAIALWKGARQLNRVHAERFNANKFVRGLLLKDMTPEGAYRLLIGMSSMTAKTQAVSTLRRLKEILGPNHAAITHVRKAVLRDALAPMFADKTNFRGAINNIDKLLQNHYSLVQELEIPISELRKLRRLAHAAEQAAGTNPTKFDGAFATSVISSVAVGHSIARKGALVRTARKLMDRWLGTGMLTKRDIKNLLVEGELGQFPIVEYSKPELSTWLAATAGAQTASASNRDREGER
jgi:hypothetical protein